MEKFQNKYRILSTRAQWHEYNAGTYFITICTAGHLHFFGKIIDTQMRLSDVGRVADDNFANVSAHYPYAKIPLFIVMPNHIHAIVIIDGNKYNAYNKDDNDDNNQQQKKWQQRWKTDMLNDKMRQISHKRGLLSIVIGGLKRAITCYARENGIDFAWQARFHDRIIRNQEEMNRIVTYIEQNVAKWDLDDLNNNRKNNHRNNKHLK